MREAVSTPVLMGTFLLLVVMCTAKLPDEDAFTENAPDLAVPVDQAVDEVNNDDSATSAADNGCVADCEGKECGQNGCGGSCGECSAGTVCEVSSCIPAATADCGAIPCQEDDLCKEGECVHQCDLIGPEGCCSGNTAYSCWLGELFSMDCDKASTLVDEGVGTPDMTYSDNLRCRMGPSGTTCSTVLSNEGTVFCPWCEPNCAGKQCGSDLCGGQCGSCPAGSSCLDGKCAPDSCCLDGMKQCGLDQECDVACGTCEHICGGAACTMGVCEAMCLCNCTGKQCGHSGCGDHWGMCPPGMYCDGSECQPPTPPP